ncbi:MAG: NADPH-dependent F420 reductase, partial [Halobacteriales archaeon]|nr:NADPH-dependent F420 reductase [Halobacteriales archaeon]
DHEIIVGARDPDRARNKAAEYETELSRRGLDREVAGLVNTMAADRGDVIVLSVPPYYVTDTIESVADEIGDAIVVSPAVGMERDDEGFHYNPPPTGSVTEHAAAALPDGVPLVGAYHNLAADRLANLDVDLDLDTLVIGTDRDAKELVMGLTREIDGLRPLDAGGIANAPEVESLTPLLLNIARFNRGMHDVGVEFK